jgi:hypothetical protein
MVNSVRGCCALALLAALASRTTAGTMPDYRVGDIAKEEVVTPIRLAVVDQAQSAALKNREAARVPVIFRYYTNAFAESQANLQSAFAAARSGFLDHLEAEFKRRNLDAQTLGSSRFQQFVDSLENRPGAFPVSGNLAQIWARGESDQGIQDSMLNALRRAMSRPIRPDSPLSGAGRFGGGNVRLVPLARWDESPTLQTTERSGFDVPRGNLVAFARARQTLIDVLPPEGRPAAQFLVSLLKTNCLPDTDLTRQARAQRSDGIWAMNRYEPGQVIVRQGQVIDEPIKAALDQLRDQTQIASRAQNLLAEASPQLQMKSRLPWIAAGSGAVVAGFLIVLWRSMSSRSAGSLLPARMAGSGQGVTIVSCPSCAGKIVVPNSVEAAADLRASVAPHLARLLADKLVRKLLSQRSSLLDTQETAAAEMAELEARLEKMHAPLQDRLRAYESRIVELEQELARKGAENQELIKLKIALARNQMTGTKDKLDLN